MPREHKFNFIPAHQVDKVFAENQELFVTVTTRPQKLITFPVNHPETRELIGKYLQFFVDTNKNIMGWKVFERGELGDLKWASVVEEQKVGKYSSVKVRAKVAINAVDYEEGKSYKKLQVRKYKESGMLADGRITYYVEIERPKKSAGGGAVIKLYGYNREQGSTRGLKMSNVRSTVRA